MRVSDAWGPLRDKNDVGVDGEGVPDVKGDKKQHSATIRLVPVVVGLVLQGEARLEGGTERLEARSTYGSREGDSEVVRLDPVSKATRVSRCR